MTEIVMSIRDIHVIPKVCEESFSTSKQASKKVGCEFFINRPEKKFGHFKKKLNFKFFFVKVLKPLVF
jgi:hypothetical protein